MTARKKTSMHTKTELRKTVRLLKKQHSQEELKAFSSTIAGKLLELPCIKEADTLMLYCSLPDEVDTMELLHKLRLDGKRILLPKVTGESDMELCEYSGDDDLQAGSYGILEPCGERFEDFGEIKVAVIPGMAFDKSGNRLGRGKGYYDRFLNKPEFSKLYKIGICFPFQLFEALPADKYDIRMDMTIAG